MPTLDKTRFGTLLREIRKQAGLSQLQLADHLHVSKSRVSKWETGVCDPPQDPEFYQPLRAVPEFTDSNITRLLEAAEKSQDSHTKSLHFAVNIRLPSPKKGADSALFDLKVENPVPIHYPHTMPEHGAQIVEEGNWQEVQKKAGSGVIYDRGRLMTLAEASRVSGVKLGTIHNYLSDGKLTERGRIKAPGGGKVLIDLDELDSVLSSRKPGGRPRKTPKHLLNKRPRGRPRKA